MGADKKKSNTTTSTISQPTSNDRHVDYKTWHGDFNIQVMSHPTNGRYIVATSDMEENDVILRDLPYTWAVDHSFKNFVCQQCFLEVPVETQRDNAAGANSKPKKKSKKDKKKKTSKKEKKTDEQGEAEEQQQEDAAAVDATVKEEEEEEEEDGASVPIIAAEGEEFHMCEDCSFVGYCCKECMEKDSHQHKFECLVFQNLDQSEYSSSLLSEIKLLIRTLSRKWLEQSLQEEGTQYRKYKQYEDSNVPQENGLRYSDYDQLVSNIEAFSSTLKDSLSYWICDPVIRLGSKYVQKKEDGVDLLNVLLRNRCNAFYIQGRPKNGGNGESRGCGVYVRNSFFNHSCNPNVNYWVVENTLEVECSLMRAVRKGEELCISYIDTAASLRDRREKLSEGYLFHCRCEKCITDELAESQSDCEPSASAPPPTTTVRLEKDSDHDE
ncbi:SET domain-containing protein [Cavenderia fasciculata]|uniref:SET domain-containing protein n=1 Tax=Cavenderia fasciculata TaxID=261658 RepID=F4PUL8_CACFS|nr:SET domain-containing protein [Cavenderia fasciculata]EGG21882.1 SET domain-containing protein [Cavenderia fasciculata]|eukprot:XP_004359733.1 SET domain-containing protein [Cavenderia fasciculata]